LPILLLAGCTTTLQPQSDPGSPRDWETVLAGSVDDQGNVGYENLDRAALNRYVAWLSSPRSFKTRADELAFWINAYNALVVYQVMERWPIASVSDSKHTFFYWTRFHVNGKKLSLYALENDIVRAFSDPRIHFALNCASKGCPRLPRKPFHGAVLDIQLERETTRFLAETRNVEFDEDTLVLSAIFKWYADDFAPDPVTWIRRRRPDVPEGPEVVYRPWDWALNAR